MTRRFLSAQEAYEWGIVTKVVSHEMLMDAAFALAEEIKKMPPLSVKAVKQAVNMGMAGYEYAQQVLGNLQKSQDAKEGARAFLEKREPRFEGR